MAQHGITRRAEDDLKHIGRYTQQHWGKAERNVYLKNLENRFNWLAESPSYGMHRTDIAEGFYNSPEGQHIVFNQTSCGSQTGTFSECVRSSVLIFP